MWCLPLQCLYGFLSRLGTIFGHGSAGVEPLICLTCNILHRLRQVICIHLPLDENIFHKVSFNSKCWIKFTYDLHSPVFASPKSPWLDQLLASEASSIQSFFISHCSGLAADMGPLFQRSRSSKLVDVQQVCCRRLYCTYFYNSRILLLFKLHFTSVWFKTSTQ